MVFKAIWTSLGVALAATLAMAFAVGAQAAVPKRPHAATPQVDPSTILVRFRNTAQAATVVHQAGDRVVGKLARSLVVGVDRSDLKAKLAEYRKRADVAYAEPNYVRHTDMTPNDPSFSSQWALSSINAPAAWDVYPDIFMSTGGAKIAVVDTGIDTSHSDLSAKILTSAGANCLSGSCTPGNYADDDGHGTHVAGIAAASTNNGTGIAGIAFSSPLIPVKVLDSTGSGTDASVAAGILWAASHGARVINLSLGGYGAYPQTLCDAVATATSDGALVVAAAGNEGTDTPSYPAACPGAVGVASTDMLDESSYFSNIGQSNVFVSAPGEGILSTYPGGYANLSGTSMAAPHVAGLAALLFGEQPARSPADVKVVIAETARKAGASLYPGLSYGADPLGTCTCTWHPYYGYGIIDAAAALSVDPAPLPVLSGMSPSHAPVGAQVTLTGSNLDTTTSVMLGNSHASFTVVSPTELQVTVPTGAASGRWQVTTSVAPSHKLPDASGGCAGNCFTVDPPAVPSLSTMSPGSGPAGTVVSLTGANLTGVTSVTLGNAHAAYTVVSATEIDATVPAGAVSGRWVVSGPAGTSNKLPNASGACAGNCFLVDAAPVPTLTGMGVDHGQAGTVVSLTGTNLTGATSVTLGNAHATYAVVSATQVDATVPAGAVSGRWVVTTPAGTSNKLPNASGACASNCFTVDPAALPTLSGMSVAHAQAGAVVSLTGANLTGTTKVTIGAKSATFTVVSATQIDATVPAGAASGRWQVTTPAGTTNKLPAGSGGCAGNCFTVDP